MPEQALSQTLSRFFSPVHLPKLPAVKSPSTLHIALGISLAVHGALLTLRLADPQRFERAFQDTPLEVILVNAKSSEPPPEQARAIAQASLAGGGALDDGRATSPLPPAAQVKLGDAQEEDERERQRVQQQREQQAQLLLQAQKELAALPPPDPSLPASQRAQTAQEQRRQQLIDLLAEIEKQINQDSAKPAKRYVSPATREEVYAVYYDAMRRRIEKKGTQHFPQLGGKKLYGELTMTMTVDLDGAVLATEVVQSSGNPVLDRWAQNLVEGAGPFEPFTPAMRAKAEQIVVVSSFNFGQEGALETRLHSR